MIYTITFPVICEASAKIVAASAKEAYDIFCDGESRVGREFQIEVDSNYVDKLTGDLLVLDEDENIVYPEALATPID